MSKEYFANDAQTLLASACDNVTTSITVASGSTFPPAGNFRIRIDNEIMEVTAVSGGTGWTVVRAVEPCQGFQQAAPHALNAIVNGVLTVAGLSAMIVQGSVTTS